MGYDCEAEPQQQTVAENVFLQTKALTFLEPTDYLSGVPTEILLRNIEYFFEENPNGKMELKEDERIQLISEAQSSRGCTRLEQETLDDWEMRSGIAMLYAKRIEDALFRTEKPLIYFVIIKKLEFSSDDDFANGSIGLLKAIRGFDSTKGFRFSSYAVSEILYSILNARNQGSEDLVHPGRSTKARFNKLAEKLKELYPNKNLGDLTGDEIDLAMPMVDWGKNQHGMKSSTALSIIRAIKKPMIELDRPVDSTDSESDTFGERIITLLEDDKDRDYTLDLKDQISKILSILNNLVIEGKLSERDKTIFLLRSAEGKKLEDIAVMYDIRRQRVQQITERCLNLVRERFDSWYNF